MQLVFDCLGLEGGLEEVAVLPARLQQRGQLSRPLLPLPGQPLLVFVLPLLPLLLNDVGNVVLLVCPLDLGYLGREQRLHDGDLVLPPGVLARGEDHRLPIVFHLFDAQLYLCILSPLPLAHIYPGAIRGGLHPFLLLPQFDQLIIKRPPRLFYLPLVLRLLPYRLLLPLLAMLADDVVDDVAIALGVDELDEIDSLPIPILLLEDAGQLLAPELGYRRLSLPRDDQGQLAIPPTGDGSSLHLRHPILLPQELLLVVDDLTVQLPLDLVQPGLELQLERADLLQLHQLPMRVLPLEDLLDVCRGRGQRGQLVAWQGGLHLEGLALLPLRMLGYEDVIQPSLEG